MTDWASEITELVSEMTDGAGGGGRWCEMADRVVGVTDEGRAVGEGPSQIKASRGTGPRSITLHHITNAQ